ncbi:SMI1/KNR4 family protein [Leptolyngbya sp. AN02str]|uniref:SMI1/KNR4 family protein n=1 Tax=Leptolyngbya sp. AN02str TaxID=3423363 RepID=UPI003D314BF2
MQSLPFLSITQVFHNLQKRKVGRYFTRPCSVEEVQKLEDNLGLRLPAAYRELLLWIGNGGFVFEGQYFRHYLIKGNRAMAIKLMQVLGLSESLPEDAIVFLHDQLDEYFYYICASEGDDPPVHEFYAVGGECKHVKNYSKKLEEYMLRRLRSFL